MKPINPATAMSAILAAGAGIWKALESDLAARVFGVMVAHLPWYWLLAGWVVTLALPALFRREKC